MAQEPPITEWLKAYANGDDVAGNQIAEQYFTQLVRAAEAKYQKTFPGVRRTPNDQDDAAVSAFAVFAKSVKAKGIPPHVSNRDELIDLLMTIVRRKVKDHRRSEMTKKRIGSRSDGAGRDIVTPSEPKDSHPTPLEHAEINESNKSAEKIHAQALDDLSPRQRQVAELHLDGFSPKEIAATLQLTIANIHQHIHRLRKRWSCAFADLLPTNNKSRT